MRGRAVTPVVVVLLAALAVALPAANAAPKPGAACKAKELGKVVRVGGKQLRCMKPGSTYRWIWN